MKIGKKFLIYLFCGLLTFSVVSSSYYKTVHAFEYVGGALAFDTALKWLLATIGITATAGMTDAYWDTYGDEFVDYAVQNGSTQQDVAEWQLKLCEGILDKGSQVWDRFMEWASTLTESSSGGSSISYTFDNFISTRTISYDNGYSFTYSSSVIDRVNNSVSNYSNKPEFYSSSRVADIVVSLNNNTHIWTKFYYLNPNYNYTITDSSVSCTSRFDYFYIWVSDSGGYYGCSHEVNKSSFNYLTTGDSFLGSSIHYGVADSDFISVQKDVTDLDVISSSGVNEADDEVSLPYPGVSDSDNTLANDTYQDIVDKINDGTITQEKGIEQIQELLRVITYDTVTDEVVPPQKNDDGTNKTKDDALKDNKDNAGFTLGGLENVFPFCIPFDIYAFMTLLVAEPECPEFDFPIKTVNGQEENIHVDLEPFEPVAVVVRYVFDFLFIVGLAMLTRSLIGGGSSD